MEGEEYAHRRAISYGQDATDQEQRKQKQILYERNARRYQVTLKVNCMTHVDF